LEVIKYLLDEHTSLVSSAEVNEKGELPVHLLCKAEEDKVDSEDSTFPPAIDHYIPPGVQFVRHHCSKDYIEAIWLILLANPEAILNISG